jgi:hypothetical protein
MMLFLIVLFLIFFFISTEPIERENDIMAPNAGHKKWINQEKHFTAFTTKAKLHHGEYHAGLP